MSKDNSPPQLRAQAEAWLAGAPSSEAQSRSPEELLHELLVSQIELEMQNESLRQSQAALEQARDRYVELYDQAPVGYLTLTSGAVVAEANITAATLLGVARKQLLDQCFDRFVAGADLDLWHSHFNEVMAQGGRHAFELALKGAEGAVFSRQVQVHCLRVDTGAGPTLRLTLTDISNRYATEDLLRKLSLAVEQSPESIVITNLAGEIEYVNDAFVKIAGYRRESLIGRNMNILQSGKTPRATYVELWDALTHGRHWKGDFINRREDGSEYVEFAIITPLRQPDGRITHYVAVKEDITGKERSGRKLDGGISRRRGWKLT
jgi:PAS domain S-box-containing protein